MLNAAMRLNIPTVFVSGGANEVLAERRAKMEASERPWQPRNRDRPVTKALRAYAALTTSADKGAVRRIP
jgi:dihydroxy-acid dehydratase